MDKRVECDICGKNFKNKNSLGSHKNRLHKRKQSVGLKILLPYEEMSNQEIAARYLKRQKKELDKDTYNKLKLKMKSLKWARPKPYDRKPPSSDDESPISPMKPSVPKHSTSKRYRSDSDGEDKPTPKARRGTKTKEYQCSVCQDEFDTKSALSLHMDEHPRCIYCDRRYKDFDKFIRHWKTKHRRLNAIQAIMDGDKDSEGDEATGYSNYDSALESEGDEATGDSNYDSALKSEGDESDVTITKDDEETDTVITVSPSESEDTDHDEHIPKPSPKKVQCKLCLKDFGSQTELFEHMSLSHPKCVLCDKTFIDFPSYLKHRKNSHQSDDADPEGKTSLPEFPLESDGDSQLDSEDSELDRDASNLDESKDDDSDNNDLNIAEPKNNNNDDADDSDAEVKIRDKLHKKHINCVTVERFIRVRNLIRRNDFDTLAQDVNLVKALRIIIKGVLEGFIPICSAQRMVLTPELKTLMYRFSKHPNPQMILQEKQNLKILFDILGTSVKVVIDAFIKYEL